MIKLQDFARECGVTDRQIHRLLSKYEDEVTGHFERQGQNGTWLDEIACDILRSKMKKTPPAVSDQQTVREKEELLKKVERLNNQLGAQGILIGQMHQEISALQQFKLDAEKERLRIEASKEAQERRERELDQREANMAEEVKMAVQEATEATKAALEGKYAQELENARKEAEKATQEAVNRKEDELHLKHQKELQEEKSRAISFTEWWSRRKNSKKNKPVPPVPPDMLEA